VLGLVDDAGKRTYTYGPTGLPRGTTTQAVPQPYRYVGTYLDPTGLYKMGHVLMICKPQSCRIPRAWCASAAAMAWL
jgi:hypothetical protein